jgi:DNA-binding MarR family transcriptional regulator
MNLISLDIFEFETKLNYMLSSSKKIKKINQEKSDWTFLSNHAHVLICLYRDAELLLREIALNVGITERAVIKILEDLEGAKILTRIKNGRRNQYKINDTVSLRHNLESHKKIGDLLKLLK